MQVQALEDLVTQQQSQLRDNAAAILELQTRLQVSFYLAWLLDLTFAEVDRFPSR